MPVPEIEVVYPSRLSSPPQIVFVRLKIATENEEKKSTGDQNECAAGESHHIHGDGPIFSGRRVVVVAEEQKLVDGVSDFVLRSFYQAQADIARRVFHTVEVAGEAAL